MQCNAMRCAVVRALISFLDSFRTEEHRTPHTVHVATYYYCRMCTCSARAFPGICGSASFPAENLNSNNKTIRCAPHMTQISFKSLIVAFSFGNDVSGSTPSNCRIYFYCVAEWSAGNTCTRYQHAVCALMCEANGGSTLMLETNTPNQQSLLFYRMRVNSFIDTRSMANEIVEFECVAGDVALTQFP